MVLFLNHTRRCMNQEFVSLWLCAFRSSWLVDFSKVSHNLQLLSLQISMLNPLWRLNFLPVFPCSLKLRVLLLLSPQSTSLKKWFLFYYLYVYVYTRMRVFPWKPEESNRSLGLALQAVVSCSMWVLGTKSKSSARVTSALHHWAVSPASSPQNFP